LDKTKLSESDICDKFIRPAMKRAGWHGLDQIYREFPLRAGRVSVRGNKAHRDSSTVLRADYALFFKALRVNLFRSLCAGLHERRMAGRSVQFCLADALVAID